MNRSDYFINGFLNANSSFLISLIRLASCIIRIWNYAAIFFDNFDADWKSYFAVWLQRVDVVTKEWEKLLILKYSFWYETFLVHFVVLKIFGVYRLGKDLIFWKIFAVIKYWYLMQKILFGFIRRGIVGGWYFLWILFNKNIHTHLWTQ